MPTDSRSEHSPVCVVAGVGPGNGEAFARRFAAENHTLALLARRPEGIEALAAALPRARAYPCDLADPSSTEAAFSRIAAELGAIDTLIYNAGSGVWGDIEGVSPEAFEQSWRINTFGLFLAARQVVAGMKARASGNIVVIGATASLRGIAKTVAFAPAKAAQRSLAQSLARHLWPLGIHVSLIIVDGVIGGPVTRSRYPDRPDEFFVKPESVADIALALTRQDRSAWSFEVEARPFGEKW
jgi:NAD(P)-dependent dehydrogenase (short-subunit alcohol dehydrogenase family)